MNVGHAAAGVLGRRTVKSPASAIAVKTAPARNVPLGPIASHKAPATMLAASSAKPVSRLNMP